MLSTFRGSWCVVPHPLTICTLCPYSFYNSTPSDSMHLVSVTPPTVPHPLTVSTLCPYSSCSSTSSASLYLVSVFLLQFHTLWWYVVSIFLLQFHTLWQYVPCVRIPLTVPHPLTVCTLCPYSSYSSTPSDSMLCPYSSNSSTPSDSMYLLSLFLLQFHTLLQYVPCLRNSFYSSTPSDSMYLVSVFLLQFHTL